MIKLSNEKPPVFDRCEKEFGISWKNTIFAYGDTIHSEHPERLTEDIIEHEKVHLKQQEEFGGVEKWWDEYFSNPDQRLKWELEAYKVQYRFLKGEMERNQLFNLVVFWAGNLSGKGYGYLISLNEAIKQITC